jgi:phage I-like protein
MTVKMDLTPADVHVDGAGGPAPVKPKRKRKGKAKPQGMRIRGQLGPGSQLHVRHLDAGDELATFGVVELDAKSDGGEEGKPVWIQLAKTGTFRGHSAGPFALTDKVFNEVVANFKATQNRRIAIDFHHASEADPTEGEIATKGAPAQGWILDLRAEPGRLMGLVEWGKLAREYIQSGGYKFFSPAIRFNTRDRVTGLPAGARMSSGALTNDPFLDGLMPLKCSNETAREVAVKMSSSDDQLLVRLRSVFGLTELAGLDEIGAALERLCEAYEMGGGGDVLGMPVSRYVERLRNSLYIPLTTSTEDMFAAIEARLDAVQADVAPEGDTTITTDAAALEDDGDDEEDEGIDMAATDKDTTALTNQVSELTLKLSAANADLDAAKKKNGELETEINTLKKVQEDRDALDIETEVDTAILTWGERKGLTDESRPHLLSFRKSNPDAFKAMYPAENPAEARLLTRRTPAEKRFKAGAGVVDRSEPFSVTLARVRKENPKASTSAVYDIAYKLRNQ